MLILKNLKTSAGLVKSKYGIFGKFFKPKNCDYSPLSTAESRVI